MEANKRRLAELVGGSVQFVIPVFQRDYNWAEEQCEQLWGDVERIGEKGHGDHFFGPVVYISTKGAGAAFTRWLLIDGQQRMTTVSLLMAAVRDHLREQSSAGSDGNAAKIQHDFLINTFEKDSQRRKLVLRERDDQTLSWLIEGEEEPTAGGKSPTVIQNYRFFRSKLQTDADLDTILSGVGRLAVVDVRLDQGTDDPQQIFESLNSTGLDLTQADLVRNYVLMGLDETEQTRLFRKFWQKIERLYSGSAAQFDTFLRDFVALDQQVQKQGRVDQVYATFRLAFEDRKADPAQLEKLLNRMVRHARYHAAFVMGTNEFPEVADRLARLRALATTPAILVMRLLHAYEENYMTNQDLSAALDLVESYLIRRDVCGLQTRSYWQQFSRLAYALARDDALGSLNVQFYWLGSTNYAFPTDGEFRHALEEEELYGRQICRTLLERLENGTSKERTDTSGYSIEHVMPQNENLHEDWQKMLGQDWKETQATWLHRLGNLTLTAYNPTLSDRPFEEKKSVGNGFNESPLRLNQFIKNRDTWTSEEMRGRGKLLSKLALKIWCGLKVSTVSLRRAKVKRLQDRQGNVGETRKGMDDITQEVFDKFRLLVQSLEASMIEVATPKSVSYHNSNAEFVCEVLPRTQRIQVLLAVDFETRVPCGLHVNDTGEWKFIPYARYDAGCFVDVRSANDVLACEPLVRQALAMSMD
jgi:uncharacterized protein with ParB-like and HNH nuclease domain